MKSVPENDAPSISIVVPVLNDNEALESLLADCRSMFGNVEIVVCDGGSDEFPGPLCDRFNARLVRSEPGRGPQLNAGAGAATADILWFVHADSRLYSGSLAAIREALEKSEVAGGAFSFSLVESHWYKPMLETAVKVLSHVFNRPYGDQAFFVRRFVFGEMGRFPSIPIMEDVTFYRRLKQHGKGVILQMAVGVSARRWESEGFFRATIRNFLLLSAFRLGMPADRLVRWYSPANRPAPTPYRERGAAMAGWKSRKPANREGVKSPASSKY